jgi:pSer/pThr/pTyr-binding forkhead associated (FHA) protein
VIAGDVSVGKTLEIYGDTPIGRSRQNAELLFQYDNENSPLSRLHCTILDEEDHFKIRDEDSANGTYLNGVRLKPLVPEDLEDGDEIELARVERGGVHLQFLVARYDENDDNGFTRSTQPTRRPAANGDDAPPAMEEDRF